MQWWRVYYYPHCVSCSAPLLFIPCASILCTSRSQKTLPWKSELGKASFRPEQSLLGRESFSRYSKKAWGLSALKYFFNPAVNHKGHVFVPKTPPMFITMETKQEIRTGNMYWLSWNIFALIYVRLLVICNCNTLLKNPLVLLQALNWFFKCSMPRKFWLLFR